MVEIARVEQILERITAWALARPDILGLAVVGSWARGTARPGSDIDLMLLAAEPQALRADDLWLAEIGWGEARVAAWRDEEYGAAWSRRVELHPPCEIEFTFGKPSWAAADPPDFGTAEVVAKGCRVLLDKARLLQNLLAAVSP
jgi:uncharacterized protein